MQNTDPKVKNELKNTKMIYHGAKRESGGIENPLACIDTRLSTTLYGNRDIIVKLIHTSTNAAPVLHEFKEKCEKEVNFQTIAAIHHLGPSIYESGIYTGYEKLPFDIHLSTFTENGDDIDYNIRYTPPFYYIVMENYSTENGWRGPIYEGDASIPDCRNIFINFICALVIECNIYNIHDPIMHFYYHPEHGLRMIDYGRCESIEKIEERFEIIKEMFYIVKLIKSMGNSSLDAIIHQKIHDAGIIKSSGKVRKERQTYRATKPYGGKHRSHKRLTRRRSTHKRLTRRRSTRF